MDILISLGLVAFTVVIIIVVVSKASYFERRMTEMEGEIRQLRQAVSRLTRPGEAAPASVQPVQEETASQPVYTAPPTPVRQEQPPVYAPPSHTYHQPETEEVSSPFSRPVEQPAPARSSRTREEWEMLIGGNLLLKVGAVALLIGVAYLMQVLSRGNVIPPMLRVLFGFMAGGALVGLGNYFHKRGAQIFAQGLMGVGIGVLYISAYVSFKSFQLIPQTAAVALMSAVTVVAIIEALRYDSLVVSLLGLFGGFLTPALIGGENGAAGGNWLGLFIYLTLLNVSLLAVVVKKDNWAVIEPLALMGTWITFFSWHGRYYNESLFGLSVAFAVVFWALFYAVDVYRTARSVDTYSGLRSVIAVVNSAALYGALCSDINRQHPQLMGLTVLMLAVVYLATVLTLLRVRQGDSAFVSRNLITSIVFLAIATYIQFSEKPMLMVTLWSLEALGLVWAGIYWQLRSVCNSGLVLFVVSMVTLLAYPLAHASDVAKGFTPVVNMRFLAYVVLSGCMGLSGVLFARSDVEEREKVVSMFDVGWAGLLFVLLYLETGDGFRMWIERAPGATVGVYVSALRYLVLGLVWMVYSVPLVWLGSVKTPKSLVTVGFISLGLGLVTVAVKSGEFSPIANFTPVINIRTAMLAAAAVVLLVQLRLSASRLRGEDWAHMASDILRLAVTVVGFEIVTVETLDWFRAQQPWNYVVDEDLARMMALGGVWALFSLPVMWIGVRRRLASLIASGTGVLLLAVTFTATQGYYYYPAEGFALLTNIRAAAFIAAAAAMVAHRRMVGGIIGEYPSLVNIPTVYRVIISLLLFELVSVETWAYFGTAETAGHSVDLRQMALSLAWLGYSVLLMCYGIWSRTRVLRFVSLGIYMVAILKVFLYDLRSLEIMYRTFSFMGLGLILIATSYLYQRFRGVIMGEKEFESEPPL